MRTASGRLALVMAAVVAAGLLMGLMAPVLIAPWLLAAVIFFVNYGLSLAAFRLTLRLGTAAAASMALAAFMLRLAFIGLSLVLVAVYLRDYFLATALSFLVLYTVYLGLEVAMSARQRPGGGPAAGGRGT